MLSSWRRGQQAAPHAKKTFYGFWKSAFGATSHGGYPRGMGVLYGEKGSRQGVMKEEKWSRMIKGAGEGMSEKSKPVSRQSTRLSMRAQGKI